MSMGGIIGTDYRGVKEIFCRPQVDDRKPEVDIDRTMAKPKKDPLAKWRTNPAMFELPLYKEDETLSRFESYALHFSDPASSPDVKYSALRYLS